MTFYPDLQPNDYLPLETSARLTSVGWLARGRELTRGELLDGFLMKLVELLIHPFAPVSAMGWHECDLCRLEAGPRTLHVFSPTRGTVEVTLGIANLLVPGEADEIFVAPSLIAHYIDAHDYAPPLNFQRAVLACPEMRSAEYFRALRERGLTQAE